MKLGLYTIVMELQWSGKQRSQGLKTFYAGCSLLLLLKRMLVGIAVRAPT